MRTRHRFIHLPLAALLGLGFRYSRPVPVGEVAATYGIPQRPETGKLVR